MINSLQAILLEAAFITRCRRQPYPEWQLVTGLIIVLLCDAQLLSGEGVIRDRRDVLSVTFEYPELDESLLVDPVIRWALDGEPLRPMALRLMTMARH